MPIFDYRCSSCGHEIEIFLKLSETAPSDCPACHAKETFTKKVSAPSFRLSGGGWYETLEKPKDKQRNIVQSDSGTSVTESKSSTTE